MLAVLTNTHRKALSHSPSVVAKLWSLTFKWGKQIYSCDFLTGHLSVLYTHPCMAPNEVVNINFSFSLDIKENCPGFQNFKLIGSTIREAEYFCLISCPVFRFYVRFQIPCPVWFHVKYHYSVESVVKLY